MTKVATIFLLYILSIQHPLKYLLVSIFHILRVEDNYNLCYLALTGEYFSSGAGLGRSRKNGATSELYAYFSMCQWGEQKNGTSYCGLIIAFAIS